MRMRASGSKRPSARGKAGRGRAVRGARPGLPRPFPTATLLALFLVAATLVHALLAHLPLTGLQRSLLIGGGLILPLAFFSIAGRKAPVSRPPGIRISFFHWAVFAVLFLAAHLYRLGDLPPWTSSDQALLQLDALRLRDRWDWALFRGGNQIEPLATWLLALYLKAVPVGWIPVRLFTVLVSLATALLSYWAARAFLDKPHSFAVLWLTGLGFLPFTVARMGLHSSLVLPAVFWVLGALGRHLRMASASGRLRTGIHLGIATGTGFYIYASWPAVALWVAGSMAVLEFTGKRRRPAAFAAFAVAALATAFPMFWARLGRDGVAYAATLFKPDVLGGLRAYLIAFFWDGFRAPPFGSAWGGSLNFLTAGLATAGIAAGLSFLSRAARGWALSFLAAALLPGVLTRYVQMHRVVQALPFFIAAAAIGLVRVTGVATGRRRSLLLLACLIAASALDAWHYGVPYQDPTRYNEESTQQFDPVSPRVVRHLRAWSSAHGPLFVLEQFHMRDFGAFAVPTYPCDASRNRSLDAGKVSWVAVLTNVHYRAFLEREFPGSHWREMEGGGRTAAGGMVLALIPYGNGTRARLDRWVEANRWLRGVQDVRTRLPWGARHDPALQALKEGYGFFKGDPYLETLYREKKASMQGFDGDHAAAILELRRAILQGFAAANVYFDLGTMLDLSGDARAALKAYRFAAENPGNRTLAQQRIEEILRRSSTPTGP